jgi:uncharacterized membrane protein
MAIKIMYPTLIEVNKAIIAMRVEPVFNLMYLFHNKYRAAVMVAGFTNMASTRGR